MDIHVISMPSTSFDWYQLIYSIISGGIAVGVFWFISYMITEHREEYHYKNLLVLIAYELYSNFIKLTELAPKHPESTLNITTEIWDSSKMEIVKRLPQELVIHIQGIYGVLNKMQNANYEVFKIHEKQAGNDTVMNMICYSIIKLTEIIGLKGIVKGMYDKVTEYGKSIGKRF